MSISEFVSCQTDIKPLQFPNGKLYTHANVCLLISRYIDIEKPQYCSACGSPLIKDKTGIYCEKAGCTEFWINK